jgi:outer membrane receptor protein involved in Fe transport
VLSGTNPNLQEETSDSLTIGAIIQPRFIPGFSLTVDYYDIKVKNIIAAASAQQIVNGCYDQPTLDNQFCRLFQRFAGPGRVSSMSCRAKSSATRRSKLR